MPDIRRSGGRRGEPPDGENPAAGRDLLEEGPSGGDFGPRRAPIRARRASMCRHDGPAQCVEPDLGERALDDRRGGLVRPLPGELALLPYWDSRDACAAVTGGLAD